MAKMAVRLRLLRINIWLVRLAGSAMRKAVTSTGGMRRALFIVLLVFTSVFSYLYWNQMRDAPLQDAAPLRPNQTPLPQYVPETYAWTWVCVNNHCERRPRAAAAGAVPGVSLATCNMLCGSTQLWPQPTGPVTLPTSSLSFTPDRLRLEISAPAQVHELLTEAFEIFRGNVRSTVEAPGVDLPSDLTRVTVKVTVTEAATLLTLASDESYSLSVHVVEGAELVAAVAASTFFGARHALETLSQLAWWDPASQSLRVLKSATVEDRPKFAYRGLLLDTARNYFSPAALRRTVDAMAATKLNVFHWHITDSHSFPFDAPSVPEMARAGAYNSAQVYAAADVEALVRYARVRGVRVLLEIDTPAHAGMGWTWGPSKGLGELAVCVGQQPWSVYCGEPPCGQLNPHNPHVYAVLEKLYGDVFRLTGERELAHIGGDEVNLECWAQHRATTAAAAPYNFTDLHDLWGNFTAQALASLKRANGDQVPPAVIIWSSNLTKKPYITQYLDPRTYVVQVWGPTSWMETHMLLDSDYRVILSHVDAWYLDCGFGKWRETGEATCDPYRPWQTVYTHRPWHAMRLTTEKRALVLGGEACLWTEQVGEDSLDARLWPRAAAFAERLWSDLPLEADAATIAEDTYTRLDTHRARLQRRRLRPERLWPQWCSHNPGMCL